MDRTNPSESYRDIPDRYYFNQARRAIQESITHSNYEELQEAQGLIDLNLLGETIDRARTIPQTQFSVEWNNQPELRDQTWRYATTMFEREFESQGFAGDDVKGALVSLGIAAQRFARVVDIIKVQRLGLDAPTYFTNILVSEVIGSMGRSYISHNQHRLDPFMTDFSNRFAEEAFRKTGMTNGIESWSWAKIYTLAESYSQSLFIREVLADLPEVSDEEAKELNRINDAFGEASNRLVTYTPKPAVGELDDCNTQIVFIDKDVSSHTVITEDSSVQYTLIKVFKGIDLSSSSAELMYTRPHKNIGGVVKRIVIKGHETGILDADLVLYKNRHLTLTGGLLSQFAKSIGMENQEVLLNSMILSQNFDLIVPVYVVDLANEEAEATQRNLTGVPITDKMRRLVLARTRVLQEFGKDIEKAIQNEEDADFAAQSRPGVAKHKVVGFMRRLPYGYKASPEARSNCLEETGSEIPDGWTYVKKHARGSVEVEDRGHKIVKVKERAGKVILGRSDPRQKRKK